MAQTLMIVNIGVPFRRTLASVYEVMPNRLVIFSQENPKWNKNNIEYKKDVLDKFYNDPLIKQLKKRKKIEFVPIRTCVEYNCVFKKLYDTLTKHAEDYDKLIIDVTGLTKEATAGVMNVSACFEVDKVSVMYTRGARADEYQTERYSSRIDEEGMPPVYFPVAHINVKAFDNKNTYKYKVFRAAYELHKEGMKRFFSKDLVLKMKELSFVSLSKEVEPGKIRPKKDIEKITIKMSLRGLVKDGLIMSYGWSARTEEMELTVFGLSLAEVFFEPESRQDAV